MKTFRDSNGLWENHRIEDVASPEGFERNPQMVLDFYNARRRQLKEVFPNDAHKVLAELEEFFDVEIITQNVDDLHERAGSTKIVHLHGELTKVCSSRDPYNHHYIQELSPEHSHVEPGAKAGDGSLLRPFIVFFGESVPMMEVAAYEAQQADIFVIIGTSLNVYPAAGLVQYADPSVPVYLIDPNPVMASNGYRKIIHIQKGASEGMAELLEILRK